MFCLNFRSVPRCPLQEWPRRNAAAEFWAQGRRATQKEHEKDEFMRNHIRNFWLRLFYF